jgi:hypothetical protein
MQRVDRDRPTRAGLGQPRELHDRAARGADDRRLDALGGPVDLVALPCRHRDEREGDRVASGSRGIGHRRQAYPLTGRHPAALVDGATPIGALFRILIPVSLPGIVAVAIFAFITAWAEVLFASVLATDATRTLAIGLRNYASQ